MQATDNLQLGNVSAARQGALQGQACYEGLASQPRQPQPAPVLSGQVNEITGEQAKMLLSNGTAIDWTPFFDDLGEQQRQSLVGTRWAKFSRTEVPCVFAIKGPEGIVVRVTGPYTVNRGSSSVRNTSLQVDPSGCKDIAASILHTVQVPASLWPKDSQMDSVRNISLQYTLTFHQFEVKTPPIQRESADHAYFEVDGTLYHY
jgi:hypothetical protein